MESRFFEDLRRKFDCIDSICKPGMIIIITGRHDDIGVEVMSGYDTVASVKGRDLVECLANASMDIDPRDTDSAKDFIPSDTDYPSQLILDAYYFRAAKRNMRALKRKLDDEVREAADLKDYAKAAALRQKAIGVTAASREMMKYVKLQIQRIMRRQQIGDPADYDGDRKRKIASDKKRASYAQGSTHQEGDANEF